MKNNADTNSFDQYLRKEIKKIPQLQPSDQFLENLMIKVENIEKDKSKHLEIKPLISINGWIMIAALVAGMIITATLIPHEYAGKFGFLDSIQKNIKFPSINIAIPDNMLFSVVILTFFFLVDIYLLSRKKIVIN